MLHVKVYLLFLFPSAHGLSETLLMLGEASTLDKVGRRASRPHARCPEMWTRVYTTARLNPAKTKIDVSSAKRGDSTPPSRPKSRRQARRKGRGIHQADQGRAGKQSGRSALSTNSIPAAELPSGQPLDKLLCHGCRPSEPVSNRRNAGRAGSTSRAPNSCLFQLLRQLLYLGCYSDSPTPVDAAAALLLLHRN